MKISLTPVQTEIMVWLSRYKYLCTAQIHTHFFQGKTMRNTEIMLARMEKKELIERISTGRSSQFNFGMICFLSKKGFEWVKQSEHFEKRKLIERPVKNPITSLNHYYHRKCLIDFFIALDKAVNQLPEIELGVVLVEYMQVKIGSKHMVATNFSNSQVSIIPDMVFTLRNKQGIETAYMVEIDTGKETIGGRFTIAPEGSILEKCMAYEKLQFESIWKERLKTSAESFEILFVTESGKHAKRILNEIEKQLEYADRFFGSTHAVVNDTDNMLLKKHWLASNGNLEKII